MNKAEALHIAITAVFREILREGDGENRASSTAAPSPEAPGLPTPRFDFVDDDFCEHNGHLIPKVACPVHGPEGTGPAPTAEELDDLTTETFEEENPMIARARRLAEQQRRRQGGERLFPEDLPMSGAGPPPEIPPNIVV